MKQVNLLFLACCFALSLPAQNWVKMETNQPADVNTLLVDAVDRNTVWATLDRVVNGYFYSGLPGVIRTTDGGQTWSRSDATSDASDLITSLHARSATTAWITTFSNTDYTGKILRTTDGGQTWQHLGTNAYAFTGSFPDLIHFFDDQHGVTMGDPVDGAFEIYTTDDGGDTWTRVSPATLPNVTPTEIGLFNGYTVRGDKIWFVTTGNRLWSSADRGQTWSAAQLPWQNPQAAPYSIAFSDDQNGMIVYNINLGAPAFNSGPVPVPLRTTDGGQTWQQIYNSNANTFDEFAALVHVPGTTGTFLAGNYDGYAYTTDYGVTWKYFENENFRMPDVDCLDPQTCFGSLWSSTQNHSGDIARWVGTALVPPGSGSSSNFNIRVTPNPANGSTQVLLTAPLSSDLDVYLLNGTSMLRSVVIPAGSTSATLDLSGVTPGVYFIRAVNGTQVKALKFFVN